MFLGDLFFILRKSYKKNFVKYLLSRILIVVVLSVFCVSTYASDWSTWKTFFDNDYLTFRGKYERFNEFKKPGKKHIWRVEVKNLHKSKSVKVSIAVSSTANGKNVKFPDDYSSHTIEPGDSHEFGLMDCNVPKGELLLVHLKI